MTIWGRRLRGAIGMGLTWGAVCGALGAVPRWVLGINADPPFGLLLGVFGFVSGVTFSAILVLRGRKQRLEQQSLPRFAAWGALGGVVVAAVFAKAASIAAGDVLFIAPAFAIATAACASGSLLLARRAMRRELPGAQGDDAELELDAGEKQKRLSGRE